MTATGGSGDPAGRGSVDASGRGRTNGIQTAERALLVLLEPASDQNASTNAILAAEAARLARALGSEMRVVTWELEAAVDVETLAGALAGAPQGNPARGNAAGEMSADVAGRQRPTAVLLADTDLGRQLAPMIAHRLGSGAVIGASDVLVRPGEPEDGPEGVPALTFVKPVYGRWLEQEIEPAPGTVPVATLDLAGMPEPRSAQADVPEAGVIKIAAGPAPAVRSLELIPPDPRTVDVVHAKRIVAAGSGSASETLLAAVRELAELLEGSVGATRPVVDDGLLPKERLIGQTGRTVGPELYVALGISGSPHHVAGVRKADKILSINRDVRAPIFQFSDVGYVANLEEVLPALVERIKEYRDAPASAE